MLFDSARPYTCTFPAGDNQVVLAVPRTLLQTHLPHNERFLSRTLKSQSPLGSLAKSMLLEVWNAQTVHDAVVERLNGAFLGVLSSAFEAIQACSRTHSRNASINIRRAIGGCRLAG